MTGHPEPPDAAAAPTLIWDPEPLTAAQRCGDACVVCSKRYPRPTARVGVLGHLGETVRPDDIETRQAVYACAECAPAVQY